MTINYATLQNTVFPASTSVPQPLRKNVDGILEAYGTQIPVDGVAGYLPGCIFIKTSGSGDNVLYVNEGTSTSADFNSIKNVPNAYGTAANRLPSPAIWEDCPVLDLLLNGVDGFYCWEDFILGPDVAANKAAHIQGQVSVFTDANSAIIKLLTDEPVGALKVYPGTTDQEDCTIGLGGITGACYLFSQTNAKAFWLEARLKKSATTTDKLGLFFGMIEEGCFAADGVLVDDTADMATKDLVGFHQVNGDTTTIDTIHDTATGSLTQVKDAAVTIVADTYVKLGMKFNPTTLVLTFYKDGVPLADTVLASDTNFPDGQEMSPIIGVKSMDATPTFLVVDWIRAAWLN